MKVQGALVIAISQSGRSPDLLATVEAYRAGGAHIVALVNDEESPLATGADTFLPLSAGPERAVAATKSCLTALAGLAQLAAAWPVTKRWKPRWPICPLRWNRRWASTGRLRSKRSGTSARCSCWVAVTAMAWRRKPR